jgi:uncharacterized membrane protein
MLGRDNRITDASLIGNVVHSATFFASTAVVALAALLGTLGNLDRAHAAVEGLASTAKTSRPLLEAKVMLLLLVFAHGFLKLSWAVRQLNHCAALIGAAPLRPDAARRDAFADRAAAVLTLAVGSFDTGLRAYYFALAASRWRRSLGCSAPAPSPWPRAASSSCSFGGSSVPRRRRRSAAAKPPSPTRKRDRG